MSTRRSTRWRGVRVGEQEERPAREHRRQAFGESPAESRVSRQRVADWYRRHRRWVDVRSVIVTDSTLERARKALAAHQWNDAYEAFSSASDQVVAATGPADCASFCRPR